MQTDHDLIGFNNYISPTIVGPCPLRPRPIVLMISRDVPSYASQKIIESLLSNLQVCRVHAPSAPTSPPPLTSNCVSWDLFKNANILYT